MRIILLTFITLSFLGCKKDSSNTKHCWQMVDNLGNELNEICNKTEQELLNCTDCGVYNGMPGRRLGDVLTSCNYFSVDDPVFCWDIGNNHHISNASEKYMNCWYKAVAPVKIACSSWERWYTRKQFTYKPTNQLSYSQIKVADYTNADTLALFKSNATIILLNNSDSLIVLQRSNDGISFH